jgi:hypothetical protein
VLQWTKCKYEKGWSAEPQSIDPERVGKYGNPPFPVDPGTQRFVPILWSVGRLTLSSDKLPKLPSEKLEPMALTPEQAEQLPEPLRGRARIHGNAFVVGDPNAPKVGDLRVAYVGRSEMTLTLIGERHGDGLRARHLPDGTELYEAREGALSTAELAGQRKQEAEDGWVPHAWFAGFVLAGTFLAFWPVRAWGRALPGPALLTGAGVLLFVPLAAMALYAATLAHAWWTPARGAAVVALAAAAGAAALLVVAGAVRQLLLPRQIAGT